ncbi:hypothetical protein [Rhizobium leguminosarum]
MTAKIRRVGGFASSTHAIEEEYLGLVMPVGTSFTPADSVIGTTGRSNTIRKSASDFGAGVVTAAGSMESDPENPSAHRLIGSAPRGPFPGGETFGEGHALRSG